ncbi:unnamed protein product, partial [Leptidea sinapis]
LILPKTLLRKY